MGGYERDNGGWRRHLPESLCMVNVQIFGVKSSQATRAAERFFKERRIPIQMVDLKQKPMSPGEIRRFVERFGLPAMLDTEGKAYLPVVIIAKACDPENVLVVYTAWPWELARNGSDIRTCGS